MSSHHSNCNNGVAGTHRRCECGEDGCDSDKLWNDFESCAQAVARLYSEQSWRSFRGAAEGTTQLYKTSVDSYKRGFDKGFQAGRSSLAKEIMTAFSNQSQFDINVVLEVIYRNMKMSNDDKGDANQSYPISSDNVAVQLFQQALTQPSVTNVSSSPARDRNSENLNSFLATQVQRHRKRQRSPTSASPGSKKQRRT